MKETTSKTESKITAKIESPGELLPRSTKRNLYGTFSALGLGFNQVPPLLLERFPKIEMRRERKKLILCLHT